MHYKMTHYLLIIVFGFFAAFIPRYIPILLFSNRKLPNWFHDWMKYVPLSLFSAMVIKGIFISKTYTFVAVGNWDLIIGGIITSAIAYFTRSMALSVIVGLISAVLLSMIT